MNMKAFTRNLVPAMAVLAAVAFAMSLVVPQEASAAKAGYLISGNFETNGLTVDIDGLASADPFKGQPDDQWVSVDWGDGSPIEVLADHLDFNFIEEDVNGSFSDSAWSGSHAFSTAGNYTVEVRVHHASFNGAESERASLTFEVVLVPQCSDGEDNDDDGYTDFGGENPDPSCESGDDDTEAPFDEAPPEDVCPLDEGLQTEGPCQSDDVCVNIGGIQTSIPEGYESLSEGQCTVIPPVVDVCSNIEGNQETAPEGYEANQDGTCSLIPPTDVCPEEGVQTSLEECEVPPTDVCDNLEGAQETVPEGYESLTEGQCTVIPAPTDVCNNIEGDQETAPEGYVANEDGSCTLAPTEPTDMCENIEGTQETVPEGFDESEGQCVESSSPAAATDLCANIDGVQATEPDGMQIVDGDQCISQGRSGGSRDPGNGGGSVLGAATSCEPLLTQYLRIGQNNDSSEVTKLQEFLNEHLGLTIPVTGFFGPATFSGVEAFQMKYGNEVLVPWASRPDSGITGPTTPTGYVYQTTRWQINNLWCEGSEAFPAVLI
jgi:hypothetical protein